MFLCLYVVKFPEVVRGDYSKGSPSERCPRCTGELKSWDNLTDHEQTLALSLTEIADIPPDQRKKHRVCTRCWLESTKNDAKT